jgi:NTE family protein
VDIALTGDGIIAGRQLMSYLRPFLQGAVTFDELAVPARVVATDLKSGERAVFRAGELERAMRASIAMPPFLTPLLDGDRTLVDGGLVDPVPVDVVREMGADVVIAVNAVSNLDGDAATVLTRVSRGLNVINPFAYLSGRRHSLNLLDVVMRSFQVVEHQLGADMCHAADVVVQPDLGHYTWIEFYRAPELIERGAAAAEGVITEIKAVVAEFGALRESA